MIELLRLAGGLLIEAGGLCLLISAIGVLRFPDLFTRLHAGSVATTLGAACVLFGLMLHSGFDAGSVKLALILLFLLFTGPVATHALASAALRAGISPEVSADTEASGEGKPSTSC